jgi:hypothetical protein
LEARDADLDRRIQADANPMTWMQLAGEMRRDWNRDKTAFHLAEILFTLEEQLS